MAQNILQRRVCMQRTDMAGCQSISKQKLCVVKTGWMLRKGRKRKF